jgi:hypothetical protein
MGMIPKDHSGPSPEQAAALREASDSGSLSNEKKFRASLEESQQRKPASAEWIATEVRTTALTPLEQLERRVASLEAWREAVEGRRAASG